MQRRGGGFGTCCLISGGSDRGQEIKFLTVFLGDSWLGTGLCSPGHVPRRLHSWLGGGEGGKANSGTCPLSFPPQYKLQTSLLSPWHTQQAGLCGSLGGAARAAALQEQLPLLHQPLGRGEIPARGLF